MNVETLEQAAEPAAGGAEYYQQYKALSTAAVGSFVLGLASAMALFDWSLLAVPVVGIVLSLYAARQLRLRQAELTGGRLAGSGLALSVVFLIAGAGYLSYEYATEVPEGCLRISYDDLAPDPEKPSELLPKSAKELDGKHVFIKGYVYPSKEMFGIREFILCRDKGDCCFGGNPKLTDRIQVSLQGPLRLDYSQKLFRVAGEFRIEPGEAKAVGGGILYRMKADHLQ
jgi:hypothetical protein